MKYRLDIAALFALVLPLMATQTHAENGPPAWAYPVNPPDFKLAPISKRVAWVVAFAWILAIAAHGMCFAQAQSLWPERAAGSSATVSDSEFDAAPTTILTMAPNGSWGAATDDSVSAALAAAIARCNGRHQRAIGCGALFTTIRGGWSLGIRCGRENILASERTLAEAEQAAIDREVELRRLQGADMPPCVRVVSVDPSGTIVAPYAADLVRMVMHRQDGSSR